jgi:hypothetical protein
MDNIDALEHLSPEIPQRDFVQASSLLDDFHLFFEVALTKFHYNVEFVTNPLTETK